MNQPQPTDPPGGPSRGQEEFEQSVEGAPEGLVADLMDFLRRNKRWWLIPIAAALLLLGGVLALGSVAGTPFIYTLF